jgi:hypothetical protein
MHGATCHAALRSCSSRRQWAGRAFRVGEGALQHGAPRLRAAAVEVADHLHAVRVAAAFTADVALLREVHLAGRAARRAHRGNFRLQRARNYEQAVQAAAARRALPASA